MLWRTVRPSFSNFFSETTGPISTKLLQSIAMVNGTKICIFYFRTSTKMAAVTKNSQNYDGLLLCNWWADLDEIVWAGLAYEPLPNLCFSLLSIFQYGRHRVAFFYVVLIEIQAVSNISSEITRPISRKLHENAAIVRGTKNCVYYFRTSSKMAAVTKNSQNYDGLLLCDVFITKMSISSVDL